MAENEYQKLPGKGLRSKGFIAPTRSYCSLWLGTDHLLQIDSLGGYTEEYKRFYFRDIQAITIRKTPYGLVWTVILACFALIFTVSALAVSETTNTAGSAILWSITGVFGLLLTIHLARGPTCDCQLKTAVQIEQLPSLKRLRNARKTLERIRPLIEEAQGSLEPNALSQPLTAPEIPPLMTETFGAAPNHPTVRPPSILKPYRSGIHPIFFGMLILSGLLDIVHIFFHPPGFIAVETLLSAAVIILGITALAKQHGTDLGKSSRTVTWISGGYVTLLLLIGYIQMMALSVSDPDLVGDQWSLIKKYSEMDPLTTPWLLVVLITNVVVASALGLAGLICFQKWRAAKNQVPVPPAIPIPPTF